MSDYERASIKDSSAFMELTNLPWFRMWRKWGLSIYLIFVLISHLFLWTQIFVGTYFRRNLFSRSTISVIVREHIFVSFVIFVNFLI